MKAITLHQPHATLIAIGVKRFETRSWPLDHRGPLAIHAAKTDGAADLCKSEPYRSVLSAAGYGSFAELPLGSIVAVAWTDGCVPTDELKLLAEDRPYGTFTPGRFATRIVSVVALKTPIPARGQQKLWNFQHPDLEKVERLLAQEQPG